VILRARRTIALLALSGALTLIGSAQTPPPTQPPPKPKPFPNSGAAEPPPKPPVTQPPAAEAKPVPPPVGTPTVQDLNGTPVYPGAEYLDSYDAGRGQRYYIYGTNTPYADIVVYYKNILKNSSNREIFRLPAMHQFDLGRFVEESMAYPPSVVVKDYSWNESPGYLVVTGTTEKRFKTVIQIVPR
jgi:hypothetical protein